MLPSQQLLYTSMWILIPIFIVVGTALVLSERSARKASNDLSDTILKMESDRNRKQMSEYIKKVAEEK